MIAEIIALKSDLISQTEKNAVLVGQLNGLDGTAQRLAESVQENEKIKGTIEGQQLQVRLFIKHPTFNLQT